MGNGIITDLYVDEDRNTPMAIFSGCATFGIGLGAIVSGFIADYTSWRWTFYSQSIFLALSLIVQFSFFQETRSNVLLQRQCKAWNKWMEEQEHKGLYVLEPENVETKVPARIICARWKPKIKGDEKEKPLKEMMKASLILPFRMLFSDDILWPIALWAAFSWSVLYVCLSAVMTMFKNHYGFTISQSNVIFASECSGAVVAVALGIWQEHFGWKHWMLRGQPEDRLYFARVECILLPIGLLIFGWAGEKGAHWSIPAVGMGIATIGITMVYLSVFNYFADAYGRHASTAIAAQNLVRNGLCGCFPLFTNQMFARLGYGWACTIFSGIGVVLCVLPCLLKHFGPRARLRSKYAVSPDNPKKPSIASDSTGASDSSGVV
jgi:MFS family permease